MRRLYPISHYDQQGDLKPPLWFYLSLIFLARTWVIWIMSLTIRPDGGKILALFYPLKANFLLGLASGGFAVLLFLIAHRKQNRWLAPIWHRGRSLLLLATLIDLSLQIQSLLFHHFSYSWHASLQLVIACWILLYVASSKRLAASFNDYQIGKKTAA